MSEDPHRPGSSEQDRISPQKDPRARRRRLLVRAIYWLGAISLGGLALLEILDISTPLMRGVLAGGLVLAGTGVIVLQAQRSCPHCGALYGYYPRLVRPNTCRHCGGEFPSWREDESA